VFGENPQLTDSPPKASDFWVQGNYYLIKSTAMAKERRSKGENETPIVDNVHPLFSAMFEVYMPQPTIQEVSELEDVEDESESQ
tara:strand:- start:349 stop:600 length:252 start_codon:yes stop_codon:yes gene_type:complete